MARAATTPAIALEDLLGTIACSSWWPERGDRFLDRIVGSSSQEFPQKALSALVQRMLHVDVTDETLSLLSSHGRSPHGHATAQQAL